ncbi:hypothetical protein RRM53_002095 [Yersinia ruckeri]|nr:hypothetical protein [Yersinia ruckeri]
MKFTPLNFFTTALALIFITLKLTGVLAAWSWWAVTAPLWILPAAALLSGAALFMITVIIHILAKVVK